MNKISLKINELILTFGYCGKAKYAPGTFGTIGATLFWLLVNNYFITNNYSAATQFYFWILLIIALCAYAFYGIKKYQIITKESDIDHKSIVVDEAVGIFIALEIFNFFAYQTNILSPLKYFIYIFLCFILFRFLDITKPSFIGVCDKKFKNAFGVMADDILCGLLSGIIISILYKFTVNSQFFELINCH